MQTAARRTASTALASGAALLLLGILTALIWQTQHRPDRSIPKLTIGSKDEIYYSHAATREDAAALGRALQTVGYFRDQGAAVLFSRNKSGSVVSFVLTDGVWNNPSAVAGFEEIGRRIAPAAGGLPIELRLVDTGWALQKTVQLGKIRIGARDEIYYFGFATQSDAEALGRALRDADYLKDRGVTVSLSKDVVTSLSFVVSPGVWLQPENVARFQDLTRRVAPSIGGLPLQLRLLSPDMEIKQQSEVR
jgi:hypothetical protein